LAIVGVAENHARPRRRRDHVDAVAQLFDGDRHRLPRFGARLARSLDAEPALRNIRIVLRASSRRPVAAVVRPEATAAARAVDVRHVADPTLVAPHRATFLLALAHPT